VIQKRCNQDAGNDRERLLEPRRKNECEKLGLVANFRKGDNPGRNEK
jgi:hypothetical protein